MYRAALLALLSACAGDATDTQTDNDTEVDTEPPVFRADDLGVFCPMGCNLETCVDSDSADCETELCLWDGRFGLDSYCTQPCDGACPEGYTCLSPEDDSDDVCMANPAECGNNIVERGEACDDGNTDDGDFCSGNCLEQTTPPSGGSFSYGQVGGTLQELEGVEPRVFAYIYDNPDGSTDLSLGTFQNTTFSLELNRITEVTPPATLSTNVTAVFGVCNYTGTGDYTLLEAFDPDVRTAAGSFTAEISCFANCFDCGGQGDTRTYEGEFNVFYVDRPF